MEENTFDRISEVDLKKTMESSYIDYAMSVIAARAVGDTMGKYHPHGDSSIYGSLVNMAQEWSMRYCLVDGHGNFGSVDGDGAAAMRYTEARLSKICMEMLADINKDTVDFVPNFDETESEPTVLPARFPNLLVNGTTGIAVGMATNIPPHNLREVIDAVRLLIDNKVNEDRDTDISELLRINGKSRIIVTELPYLVNKAKLLKNIADLVKDKKIDGITDLRDESDREGMRVVIELRRDVNANIILNQLYKHTQLQDSFGIIMLALVNNEPHILNLLEMLKCYLLHQEDVVRRRTQFDLNKAEERAHILEGLLKAIDTIDEVIRLIRSSKTVAEAKEKLIDFLKIDDAQASAIVEMRLRALAALEREKLQNEYDELQKKIAEYKAILADPKKLLMVIRDEISVIYDKYGDDRKTSIGFDAYDISMEDMIPKENTVLAMTSLGYIKRMSVDNFSAQNRGGRGIKGITTIENDYIEDLLMTTTHNYVMFFTNMGRVYRLKAYEIPEGSRNARGTAIVNLLQLSPNEKITATIPIKDFEEDRYLFMVTKKGIVKKTRAKEFANVRKNGLFAINLREDDELVEVKHISLNEDIFIVTKYGMCIRFKESDVRNTGRAAMGVIGVNLIPGDDVVGMQLMSQGEALLLVTENGIGKRTSLEEFHVQKRGGKGVKCYKITEKTGDLVGVKAVNPDHEVMLITDAGVIIQIRANDISEYSRITMGVKLMNLDEGVRVAKVAKVRAKLSDGNNDIEDIDTETGDDTEVNGSAPETKA